MLNNTERAIAKTFYRLVYEKKQMTIEEVPNQYKVYLDEYLKEIDYKKEENNT